MEPRAYKVATSVPREYLEEMMDRITERIEPLYPGYDRVFSYWPITGTWRPLEGSDPFIGTPGKIETAEECRLEFAVAEKDLAAAVRAIRDVHPYEEPAIDVIPMVPWKDVIASDGN